MTFRSLLLSAPLCFLLVSCGPSSMSTASRGKSDYLAGLGVTSLSTVPSNPVEASSFWDGDSIKGDPLIRINRAEQKAYFYKGDQLVGLTPISTGDSQHPTPPGSFKVSQKNVDHRSSRYGRIINPTTGEVVNDDADIEIHKPGPGEVFEGASMEYFLRFNWGIGMHAGYLPGYPASHGCVRLPERMARKFFENARLGTPVIVE